VAPFAVVPALAVPAIKLDVTVNVAPLAWLAALPDPAIRLDVTVSVTPSAVALPAVALASPGTKTTETGKASA
jgi:hypothetical protein